MVIIISIWNPISSAKCGGKGSSKVENPGTLLLGRVMTLPQGKHKHNNTIDQYCINTGIYFTCESKILDAVCFRCGICDITHVSSQGHFQYKLYQFYMSLSRGMYKVNANFVGMLRICYSQRSHYEGLAS